MDYCTMWEGGRKRKTWRDSLPPSLTPCNYIDQIGESPSYDVTPTDRKFFSCYACIYVLINVQFFKNTIYSQSIEKHPPMSGVLFHFCAFPNLRRIMHQHFPTCNCFWSQ